MNIEKVLGSITELSESNDIYMTLDVLILTSTMNANGAKFQPDFIHEIVANKEFYKGLPLVCERQKLESGKYKNLTHAKKKDNTLNTQMIGSYVDFSEKQDDDEWSLFGTVRVFKRYEKVCEAIRELYEKDSLFFSVEVLVGEYTNVKGKTREIGASSNNKFFGDCIVSFPAESKSTAYLLIAEALDFDIGGVNEMNDCKEFFQNARISIENSELDLTQIQRKLYARCREKLGEEFYNYYSTDFGVNYLIMYESNSGDYYKMDFTVSDSDVGISELYKVTKNYVPIVSENDLMVEAAKKQKEEEDKMTLEELQVKLDATEKEVANLTKVIADKDALVAEKEELVKEKETLISEKDVKINELSENVNKLSETVVVKDNEIAELVVVKAELDKINLEKAEAEKTQKIVDLKTKYSKLLNEKVLVELSNEINELNEGALQAKVTEIALEKANSTKTKETLTSAKLVDDISIHGSDVVSKYITMGR